MSRTFRSPNGGIRPLRYRNPKTKNEISQIDLLIHDDEMKLRNRDKAKVKNIPTAYDDISCSANKEDYSLKHWYSKK